MDFNLKNIDNMGNLLWNGGGNNANLYCSSGNMYMTSYSGDITINPTSYSTYLQGANVYVNTDMWVVPGRTLYAQTIKAYDSGHTLVISNNASATANCYINLTNNGMLELANSDSVNPGYSMMTFYPSHNISMSSVYDQFSIGSPYSQFLLQSDGRIQFLGGITGSISNSYGLHFVAGSGEVSLYSPEGVTLQSSNVGSGSNTGKVMIEADNELSITSTRIRYNGTLVNFASAPCYGTAVIPAGSSYNITNFVDSVVWDTTLINSSNASIGGGANEIVVVQSGIYNVSWVINFLVTNASTITFTAASKVYATNGSGTNILQPGGCHMNQYYDPALYPYGMLLTQSGSCIVDVTGSNIGFYLTYGVSDIWIPPTSGVYFADSTTSGFPFNPCSITFSRIN